MRDRTCRKLRANRASSEELALRTYTTRLLGRDPALVLHGGGNTLGQDEMEDLIGEAHEVLCVKGSGRDMGAHRAGGLRRGEAGPSAQAACSATALSDERHGADTARLPASTRRRPTRPWRCLLHAFLPHTFIDHTHANAMLALVDRPDGEELAREVYGDRLGFVPYHHAGFRARQGGGATCSTPTRACRA